MSRRWGHICLPTAPPTTTAAPSLSPPPSRKVPLPSTDQLPSPGSSRPGEPAHTALEIRNLTLPPAQGRGCDQGDENEPQRVLPSDARVASVTRCATNICSAYITSFTVLTAPCQAGTAAPIALMRKPRLRTQPLQTRAHKAISNRDPPGPPPHSWGTCPRAHVRHVPHYSQLTPPGPTNLLNTPLPPAQRALPPSDVISISNTLHAPVSRIRNKSEQAAKQTKGRFTATRSC